MDTVTDRELEHTTPPPYDALIIGHGLSGLVAAYEAVKGGKRVAIVDQEGPQDVGGQAFWSLGGLFMVDTPEQRRLGVHDSVDLAWRDWQGSAQFRSDQDTWPRRWARAYIEFSAGPMREYLRGLGLRLLPSVGWAERGGGRSDGHGNSVPRFHLTWGTGPEVVRIFVEPIEQAVKDGMVTFYHRHRVDELLADDGSPGVRGVILATDDTMRGQASTREAVGEFELHTRAIVIASGGIGGNVETVREKWPTERWGPCPDEVVVGVPAHVDGRMLQIAHKAGAELINDDRAWHYPEGMINWDPIWPGHGIRIIPGPSALWLDAKGQRLPAPYYPGADNLGALEHIVRTGHGYSWFVLNATIAKKEFIFSGSEQNPDLTDKKISQLVGKMTAGMPGPIQAFMDHGCDWVQASTVEELVEKMNLIGSETIAPEDVRETIESRDSQVDNPFSKDFQVNATTVARKFLTDRVIRTAKPHRILDPKHGPLIAVRLHILTRKTLGGIHTDLAARVLTPQGDVLKGLYAVGEAAGFGGGGYHGENALEGTFLGGCIFSGRIAGRSIASQ